MASFRPESGAHRDPGSRLCWLGTCLDRSCTVWLPSRTAGRDARILPRQCTPDPRDSRSD